MKKYWVFSYPECYPAGGMNDFDESFDTQEEAVAFAEKKHTDQPTLNIDVTDSQTGEIVLSLSVYDD
jgi:hypothetical protein